MISPGRTAPSPGYKPLKVKLLTLFCEDCPQEVMACPIVKISEHGAKLLVRRLLVDLRVTIKGTVANFRDLLESVRKALAAVAEVENSFALLTIHA